MDMQSLLAALQGVIPDHWFACLTTAVAVCSAMATVLPAPKADSGVFYRVAYALVQLFGFNKGKATNAQDQKTFTFHERL